MITTNLIAIIARALTSRLQEEQAVSIPTNRAYIQKERKDRLGGCINSSEFQQHIIKEIKMK